MGLFGSSFRYHHWNSQNFLYRNCGHKIINKVAKRQVDLDSLPLSGHLLSSLRLLLLAVCSANQLNQLQTRCLAVAHSVRIPRQQLQQAASGHLGKILLAKQIRLLLARELSAHSIPSSNSSRAQVLVRLGSSSSHRRRETQEPVFSVVLECLGKIPIRRNRLAPLVPSAIVSLCINFGDLCADFDVVATGGAFGGSSAFGTNQAQQQPAASGGLFGQPQQSTGAFGTLGMIFVEFI